MRMARIVARNHRAAAERLRAHDLSHAQFDVLAQLGSARGIKQRDLAVRLLVTQGDLSQLLSGLERKGLVERRREGRCKHLFLTEAGRALYAEVVPAHEAWQEARIATLTEPERRELMRLLGKLDRATR